MVNTIVEKFSISQRALAAYMDSDHSILSRYAAGDIYLQANVFPILLKIYTLSVAITESQPAKPSEEEKIELQKAANWCRTQYAPLQKKLAKIILQYQQACNTLKLLSALGNARAGAAPKKQR